MDNKLFNKVVNDILVQVKPVYLRKKIAAELLSLIESLQEEKVKSKKILANRVYADSTLKSMTKAELIEHIRILEHNWSAAEETLANSVKNSEQIFYEQKEEIERLEKEVADFKTKLPKDCVVLYNEDAEAYRIFVEKYGRPRYIDGCMTAYAHRLQTAENLVKDAANETLKELEAGIKDLLSTPFVGKTDKQRFQRNGMDAGLNMALELIDVIKSGINLGESSND